MAPRLRTLLMTSTALLALGAGPAGAQPTGPTIVGGHVTVTGAGTPTVSVHQSSERGIINWHTFNISSGGAVNFYQPGASSITLNRVTGGLGPSMINGTLNANGRVFIINRDGMLFGRGAAINTAGFLASTHDIRNEDFMAGQMNFNISGNPQASIVNLGAITAHSGGFAALVAPGVRNSGTITANLGTVALASGNSFTLDMYGDKLIQLAVGDQIASQVIDVETGKPLSSLVTNEGTLRANGGRVEITAAAARHIVHSVINTSGVIEANTVGTRAGRIVLGGATRTAGLPKQTIQISGKVSATGKEAGQKGGTIQITGEDIRFAAAMIDASGHSGGGRILVGGDYGGGKPLPGAVNGNQSAVLEPNAIPTASTVTVDGATTFNASATVNGNGGKVILWSDTLTTFAGTIFARGGEFGGNGGFVEVSGKESLAFSGMVNTLAPNGAAGTLLLDPFATTVSTSPNSVGNLNVDTLVELLTGGNVTVTTSSGGQSSSRGNLTISAAVTWTAATTLTLQAKNNLNINAPITGVNGGLIVDAGIAINTTAAINVGTFTLVNGNWTQLSATLPAFHATDFRIVGGQFLRATGGDGSSASPYQIADVYGLQGIGSSSTLLASNYRLANDIDASGTASWNSGQGFQSIGNALSHFTGSLNGQGFTINGLTIAAPNSGAAGQIQTVGLFGTIGVTGSVSNLNITNASVATFDPSAAASAVIVAGTPRPSQLVGILAGQSGGTISNVSVSGTINGLSTADMTVGGLVGLNGLRGPGWSISAGTIINAHANVNVTVADGTGLPCPSGCWSNVASNAVGGLVGANIGGSSIVGSSSAGSVSGGAFTSVGGLVGLNSSDGGSSTITNSFSTANVSASGTNSVVGGLVGSNAPDATISGSYATGAVAASGGATAGGFVGENHGAITTSYASGAVTLTNSGATDAVAGGFAGTNQGTISESYATGAVSSTNGDVMLGGFVGVNFNSITNSYATGNVTATGATLALLGGFAGGNDGTITGSHATGSVSTNAAIALAGGFVGLNFGEITLSYATGNVTVGDNSFAGGFVGFNSGTINQTYATGAVTAGANSFAGGFVGVNVAIDFNQFSAAASAAAAAPAASPGAGSISQSYALGPVTGSNATVAAAFAALNLGSLDQIYAAGRVQGGPGSTLGGLVGMNTFTQPLLPGLFEGPQPTLPTGAVTNSYWDMQTTGLTTSAGGTGLNTAVLVGGLPSGFDPNVWGNPAYPYLVNLGPQNTDPGTPVIPPVGGDEPPASLPPAAQQINPNVVNPPASSDPVPNVTQFVAQQQQQQQRQAQSAQQTTGSIAQDPIRLDVGENRYFYLPPATETRLVSDEVVLQMPCNVPQAALETILKRHNLTIVASQCLTEGGTAAFRMRYASEQTISSVIRALADHQVIVAAQANYVYALTETKVQSATTQQGDPGQYVPEKLRLYAAHRIVTGNNVPIGVIDSEIDGAHPDLTGTIANKYDATGLDDNPHAHGTGMAGAIVSHQKLLGVAPGARILAIRAFSTRNANPESTTFHILRGIDHAIANNVRIVNMSFAGPRDPSLERALKSAHDKGIVLIAAAGNAGPRAPAMYPAADPHVIAVTATDIDDRLFAGANRGNYVAISAPGVDILVPAPAGEYQVTTGTSVATAHISGVVALMLERNPRLTPVDVRNILTASAKRLGPPNLFGAGLVDPMRAIELATPRSTQAPAAPKRTTAAPQPARTAAAMRP